MNMENNPTVDELRGLIQGCDDRAGDHVLWVGKNGDVHVSRIPKNQTSADFEQAEPDMRLRCEAFEAGNEYVGPEAARDNDWIKELFRTLITEWPNAKMKPEVEHIGQF
jgi:hypothetical protein